MGTGLRPVLTKDNKGRKGLEPRPGADSLAPCLSWALPTPSTTLWCPLPPVPVWGGVQPLQGIRELSSLPFPLPSSLVASPPAQDLYLQGQEPLDCPPLPISPHVQGPLPLYYLLLFPELVAVLVGGRVSGPRVREQEETSGFPLSSRGPPPLSPPGLQPLGWSGAQGSRGQEVSAFALPAFRPPEAMMASRPLT